MFIKIFFMISILLQYYVTTSQNIVQNKYFNIMGDIRLDIKTKMFQDNRTNQRSQTVVSILKKFQFQSNNCLLYSSEYSDIANKLTSNASTQSEYYEIRKNVTSFPHEVNDVLHKSNKKRQQHFMVLADEFMHVEILKQIQVQDYLEDQQGYFVFLHKWILVVFINNGRLSETLYLLEKNLGLVNNVVVLFIKDCSNCFYIYTAMWDPNGRYLSKLDHLTHKMSITQEELFPNTQYGLNRQHVTIVTQTWPGFVEQSLDVVTNQTVFTGAYVEVMALLGQFMNCTFDVTLPPDGLWGSKGPNNSWTGIVGMLQRRQADFAVAILSHLYERTQAMDFADIPLAHEFATGVYKKPKPITNTLALYAKPFSIEVWLLLCGSTLIYGVIIWLFTRLLQSDGKVGGLFVIWNLFKSFFGQASAQEVSKFSQAVSILWLSWFLFAFLITSLWTCSIISFLTTTVYPETFTNLEELILQDTYKIGILGKSSYETTISNPDHASYKKLWNKVKSLEKSDKHVLSSDNLVHLNTVISENYVYITNSATVRLMMAQHCQLTSMPDRLILTQFAIGMQKNSAYKELVNDFSLKLAEFGIIDHLLAQFFDKGSSSAKPATDAEGNQCENSNINQVQISFYHLQFVFIALLFALAFCLGVFVTEVLCNKGRIVINNIT